MWITAAEAAQTERGELARRATALAREQLPGVDIEFLWDGLWIRRVGQDYFPDPSIWDSPEPKWQRWAETAAKYNRDVNDYWFHVYKPAKGDVIVDIGAGRGEDVFVFSQAVGPEGKVWAIEPHPVSFLALTKQTQWNRQDNVVALNYACVDRPAPLQIETLPVWESNYVRQGEPSPTSHAVEGRTFDQIAAEHGIDRIDFLKMNIEGAERFALPGCREALERANRVCVAAHDFRANRGEGEEFRTLGMVKSYLTERGFRLITRDEDPRYYVPYHVHGVR